MDSLNGRVGNFYTDLIKFVEESSEEEVSKRIDEMIENEEITLSELLHDENFLNDEVFDGIKAVTRAFIPALDKNANRETIIRLLILNHAYTTRANRDHILPVHKIMNTLFEADIQRQGGEVLEVIKQVPFSKIILPATHYILNSKVGQNVGKGLSGQGELDFTVSPQNKLEPVTVFVNISFDDEDVRYSRKLTTWDRTVHNAICTLWKAGNSLFTAEEIYRTMNGLSPSEFVHPNTLGAVTKSIKKLGETNIEIDYTEHMLMNDKALKLKDDERIELKGKILAIEEITLRKAGVKGGVIKKGYRLLRMEGPILLQYSEAVKQVISVPYQMLNTKDATRSTQEVIVLREYLLTRISQMKSTKNKLSNKMLYSTILDEMEVPQEQRNADKMIKVRKHIKDILELWQRRDKFIKGFTEYKEGKTFVGVEIFF